MKKILYLTALMVLLVTVKLEARHIVGGEVTYECLGIDVQAGTVTFKITVLIYRDSFSGGAQFDDPAPFGLYRGSGNNWSYIQTYNRPVVSKRDIDTDTGNPCLEKPDNIGVEEGRYEFDITVPISSTDSYQIVYQRCCRNNTIFNIIGPEETGAAYSVEISPLAQMECDNSPTFDEFPPVVICANTLLSFDHGATDVDGDIVQYVFCNPIAAGGTEGIDGTGATLCDGITPSAQNCPPPHPPVQYKTALGYTTTTPLGGDPIVTISANTGLINGVPNVIGQFVVGVCAISYRNGVEIGRISRDFQFNVTTCEIAVQALVNSDEIVGGNVFIINSCGDNTVEFDNRSIDATKILSYDWELYVGADTARFNTRDITYAFPDTGTYNVKMFLNRDELFADCKDTANIQVNVFPEVIADFSVDYDTCTAGPVDFTDESFTISGPIEQWAWDFGDGDTSEEQNPSNIYEAPGDKQVTLLVTDKNNCTDDATETFPWFPAPPILVVEPNQFEGCRPAKITFNNLSSPIDESYEVIWDFGDGNTVDEISPMHTYTDIGTYNVSLFVKSPLGCSIDQDFDGLITVLDSPLAGFSYTPDNPNIFNKTVSFVDESQDAIAWLYEFGDLPSTDRNPTYTFPDTGLVEVIQVVFHPSGCTDTAFATIDIEPLVTLALPNAFTPNDDGLNDDFRGKGFFDGFRDYKMQIWNRWGEKIYEGSDPSVGWDGKKQTSGDIAPAGVYIYTVEYSPPRGEAKKEKGHVTLIR